MAASKINTTDHVFPSPGDIVEVTVKSGGYSPPGDVCERVLQVNPYGILVSIVNRYHVPEYDRQRPTYAGDEYHFSEFVAFYPWTNVSYIRRASTPRWLTDEAGG